MLFLLRKASRSSVTLDSYLVYDVSLAVYFIISPSKLVLIPLFSLKNFILFGFLSPHSHLPWNPVSLLISLGLERRSFSLSSPAVEPACILSIKWLVLTAGKKTNLAQSVCVRGIGI